MAAALIVINQSAHSSTPNGTAGISRDDIEAAKEIQLVNSDDTGVRSYSWELLDKPAGSIATLSNPLIPNPTFTPDLEGTYRIRLTVNDGNEGEVDTRLAVIRDSLGLRLPAFNEEQEANWSGNTLGWKPDLDLFLSAAGGSGGRDWKESCRVATVAPGTLASDFEAGDTVDGVVLALSDRILIQDQASGAENGIYIVAATGIPSRATDFDTDAEVTTGATTWVAEGTANADKYFTLNTLDPITVGVTALVFVQTGGGGVDTWSAVLAAGAGSGGTDPVITDADFLLWQDSGSFTRWGIEAATGEDLDFRRHNAAGAFQAVALSLANANGNATFEAQVIPGTSVEFTEAADLGFGAPTATKGRVWVRSDAPNVLVFTDDADTDWVLNTVAGGAETLAQTLTAGNTFGATNMVMDHGQSLRGEDDGAGANGGDLTQVTGATTTAGGDGGAWLVTTSPGLANGAGVGGDGGEYRVTGGIGGTGTGGAGGIGSDWNVILGTGGNALSGAFAGGVGGSYVWVSGPGGNGFTTAAGGDGGDWSGLLGAGGVGGADGAGGIGGGYDDTAGDGGTGGTGSGAGGKGGSHSALAGVGGNATTSGTGGIGGDVLFTAGAAGDAVGADIAGAAGGAWTGKAGAGGDATGTATGGQGGTVSLDTLGGGQGGATGTGGAGGQLGGIAGTGGLGGSASGDGGDGGLLRWASGEGGTTVDGGGGDGGSAQFVSGDGGNAVGTNQVGGAGGLVLVVAGDGGSPTGSGAGGAGGGFSIIAGGGATGATGLGGAAGALALTGGAGGAGGTSQPGLTGGNASLIGGVGGAGNASIGGSGGNAIITPGSPGASAGSSAGQAAGSVTVTGIAGGNASTAGAGGQGSDVDISAGAGGNAAGSNDAGPAGSATITGGAGGTASTAGTSVAGAATLKGGAGGTAVGGGETAHGGQVILQTGAAGSGGDAPHAGEILFKVSTTTKWNITTDGGASGGGLIPGTTNDVDIGLTGTLVRAVYSHDFIGSAEVWLRPTQNEPPASNFATPDTQNARPCLDFDNATEETAVWTFTMPAGYNGGKIQVTYYWAMTSTNTLQVLWECDFESVADGEALTDNVFDTETQTTNLTVPGTAGLMSVDSVTVAVADLDVAAANDLMRIRVRRNIATTPSASDAELYAVHLKEVA